MAEWREGGSEGEGEIYDSVGLHCGTAFVDGREQQVIGILLTQDEDEEPPFHMTIPAVKALIVDLQEAISHCLDHQQQKRNEGK